MSNPNLDLGLERKTSGNLEFDESAGPPVLRVEAHWRTVSPHPPQVTMVTVPAVEVAWSSASQQSLADFPADAVMTGSWQGANLDNSSHIVALHDINVFRGPSCRTASHWRPRGEQQAPQPTSSWTPLAPRLWLEPGNDWQQAGPLELGFRALQKMQPQFWYQPRASWQEAAPLRPGYGQRQRDLPRFWYQQGGGWQEAAALLTFRTSGYQYPPPMHRQRGEGWQESAALHRRHHESYRLGAEMVHYWLDRFETAGQPAPGRSVLLPPVVPEVPVIGASDANLNLWYPRVDLVPGDLEFVLRLLAVKARRVYIVINHCTIARLDDGRQLHPIGISISADTDSWAWTLSVTLSQQDALDIVGGAFNDPVEVAVTLNGQVLHFIVDRWSDSRSFNSYSITLGGMSKTGLLGQRYSLPTSYVETSQRSAVQLLEQVLPNGWTSTWGLEDWLVPGGVFHYASQTPMQVISRIAASAGGFVLSDLINPQVHIKPVYKKAPWLLTMDDVDLSLPIDQFTTLGRELLESDAPNAVFVHGEQQGLLGRIYREGTAGDRLAEMVVDSLMTDAIALRQRGQFELARQARYQRHSLQTVLDDSLGGLILPGQVLEIRHPAPHIGFVKGVSIEGALNNDALVINQNITLDYPL